MKTKDAVVFYENVPVRKQWYNGEQWMSALDVCKALGYENPSKEVTTILNRNKERLFGYTWTTKMGVHGIDGYTKNRKMIFLNLKGVVAFCMLCNLKTAIPFQRWADEILSKHINKIPSDIKLIATTKRVRFTDELKEHGLNKPYEYALITKSMKNNLGIDENKPKSECDLIEVMKIAASEDIARINILQNDPNGYGEIKPICDQSANGIRILTETKKLI